MPKIKMYPPSKTLTLERAFQEFKVSQAAKGVKDKTVETYGFHFHAASKHLDMSLTFDELTKHDLDQMIVSMRKSGLAHNSISSCGANDCLDSDIGSGRAKALPLRLSVSFRMFCLAK